MDCEQCGQKMFESTFSDCSATPMRSYEGAKCVNYDCPRVHIVIEKDVTKNPKCSVTYLTKE